MRVRREPGWTAVITVTGEVDIATVAGLRDRLFTLADTSRSVIVDLDQVSFIDAAGLGALVGAASRADIHGASLQVVCGQPQTRGLPSHPGSQAGKAGRVNVSESSMTPRHE